MSDGLTQQPQPLPVDAIGTASPPASRVIGQMALVMLAFAVVGAAAGVVWWWLWTPPRGSVVNGGWYPDETGLRGEYSGTGWYVVVALVAGLLLGVAVATVCDRAELATLVAVVVGSVLAAWLMRTVGQHLGPPDPDRLARTTSRATLPDDLRVGGWVPLIGFPFASLFGLCLVYLLFSGRRARSSP